MSLANQGLLSTNGSFRARVFAAAVKSALQIVGEANGGVGQPTSAESAKRQQLGLAVLRSAWLAEPWASALASAVAANATILATFISSGEAAISDADIEFAVNAAWNDLAGITTA